MLTSYCWDFWWHWPKWVIRLRKCIAGTAKRTRDTRQSATEPSAQVIIFIIASFNATVDASDNPADFHLFLLSHQHLQSMHLHLCRLLLQSPATLSLVSTAAHVSQKVRKATTASAHQAMEETHTAVSKCALSQRLGHDRLRVPTVTGSLESSLNLQM